MTIRELVKSYIQADTALAKGNTSMYIALTPEQMQRRILILEARLKLTAETMLKLVTILDREKADYVGTMQNQEGTGRKDS